VPTGIVSGPVKRPGLGAKFRSIEADSLSPVTQPIPISYSDRRSGNAAADHAVGVDALGK
jgi:hypothetical protein